MEVYMRTSGYYTLDANIDDLYDLFVTIPHASRVVLNIPCRRRRGAWKHEYTWAIPLRGKPHGVNKRKLQRGFREAVCEWAYEAFGHHVRVRYLEGRSYEDV